MLLVLRRRYEFPVTCPQVAPEVELPSSTCKMYCGQKLLSAARVDWKGKAQGEIGKAAAAPGRCGCCCSPAAAAASRRFGHEHNSWSGSAFQKVYKWEYMEYYSLNRGEDGACSVMTPPSPTTSSTTTTTTTTSSNMGEEIYSCCKSSYINRKSD